MDVETLKKVPLFSDVADESLAKIAVFTQLVEFPEGKVIVSEGGFSNDFFAILEGTVEVEKDGETVATLGEGEVFGEQGLLQKQERSASVVAKTTTRAIKIEHWELARMRKAMPEVVDRLQQVVEQRTD